MFTTNCQRCVLNLLQRLQKLSLIIIQSSLMETIMKEQLVVSIGAYNVMAALSHPRGETASNPIPVIFFRLSFDQFELVFALTTLANSLKMDIVIINVVQIEAAFALQPNAHSQLQRQPLWTDKEETKETKPYQWQETPNLISPVCTQKRYAILDAF